LLRIKNGVLPNAPHFFPMYTDNADKTDSAQKKFKKIMTHVISGDRPLGQPGGFNLSKNSIHLKPKNSNKLLFFGVDPAGLVPKISEQSEVRFSRIPSVRESMILYYQKRFSSEITGSSKLYPLTTFADSFGTPACLLVNGRMLLHTSRARAHGLTVKQKESFFKDSFC